jgi:hypothetical protein
MFHMQLHQMQFIHVGTAQGVQYLCTGYRGSPHAMLPKGRFPSMLTNLSDQDPMNVAWAQTNAFAGS